MCALSQSSYEKCDYIHTIRTKNVIDAFVFINYFVVLHQYNHENYKDIL